MCGELHVNRVLYKKQNPKKKPVFRQIAVVEMDQFLVKISMGEVIQRDPKFFAESSDAEVFFHPTLKQAIADAESEFQSSVNTGEWEPYDPMRLCSVCGNPLEPGTDLATANDGTTVHDECYVASCINAPRQK